MDCGKKRPISRAANPNFLTTTCLLCSSLRRVGLRARGTESPGGGLTDHPKLIEKFSRRQIGRLERSPKWSRSHAIF
jgi:hypothetical protein